MPSTREIRRRIGSVRNLAQITKAMEMVSASKMRRAQRNVLATRPYADRLVDLIGEVSARAVGSRVGTLFEVRPVSKVAVLMITPDRGLCGSLVTNVLRRTARFALDARNAGHTVEVAAIGKKGRDFAVRSGMNLVSEVTKLGDYPKLIDILGVATGVINGFAEGRYDEVHLVYSQFVNTLVQRPVAVKVLPVAQLADRTPEQRTDYTYEPDQIDVMDVLLPRYIEVQIYQAVLESIASEHSARMVAMRNATDNAKDLRRDLTLSYNKTRQANITKEVSEIASGAAALADL